MIDRKYKILAVNPCSGKHHTEEDSILFCAKDAALPDALKTYRNRCAILGCGDEHLESVDLLISRVMEYQDEHGYKVPDIDTPCEIDRCIGGKV